MSKRKFKEGLKVRVSEDNDNENYDSFRNKDLIITSASNSGIGYDAGFYPEMLCNLKDAKTGESIPFSLYEYELDIQ